MHYNKLAEILIFETLTEITLRSEVFKYKNIIGKKVISNINDDKGLISYSLKTVNGAI